MIAINWSTKQLRKHKWAIEDRIRQGRDVDRNEGAIACWKDASPELSEDKQENQKVAEEIKESILSMEFNRKMFNGNVVVMRKPETEPSWSVKAKGAWQGYTIDYLLYISSNSQPIPS